MANNNERSLQYRIFLLMTIFVFSIAIQSLTITNGNNAFANKNDDIVVQAKPLPSLPVETGKLMYVVNIDDNSVSVINTDVNYVPGPSMVVGDNPVGIAFDSIHARMYVTNLNAASVSVIDTNTNTVIGSPIAVGNAPFEIIFDPVHNRMSITNLGHYSVSVMDTNNVIKTGSDIPVGNRPAGIAFASSIK